MNDTQSHTSAQQQKARETLAHLYTATPLNVDGVLRSLGLFMRSSCLAKLLYINELYNQILHLPGSILEFGVGAGQNMALFTNLRAIYEPYNYTRKVIGFDFFLGLYDEYLKDLLDYHENENVLSHIGKYALVKGNIKETLEPWLFDNPTLIALAYLDIQDRYHTVYVLSQIKSRLMSGSIVAFDELNNAEYPGETWAYLEEFDIPHTMHKSNYLPDRCYARIK